MGAPFYPVLELSRLKSLYGAKLSTFLRHLLQPRAVVALGDQTGQVDRQPEGYHPHRYFEGIPDKKKWNQCNNYPVNNLRAAGFKHKALQVERVGAADVFFPEAILKNP